MEKIIIEQSGPSGFNVIQGDKYSEYLGFDEMLGMVATLTMSDSRPHLQWMKTKEEHEAQRKSWGNKSSTEPEFEDENSNG